MHFILKLQKSLYPAFKSADKLADKQTDATECPTHAGGYAGVGN